MYSKEENKSQLCVSVCYPLISLETEVVTFSCHCIKNQCCLLWQSVYTELSTM